MNPLLLTTKSANQWFDSAIGRGSRGHIIRWLRRQPNHLINFDDWKRTATYKERYDVGVMTIAISEIVGSVGRADDFHSDFLPANEVLHTRTVDNSWRACAYAGVC